MKRMILVTLAALTLGATAGAQSVRPNAPDLVTIDLGVATAPQFSFTQRPDLNLYGNVTLQERLYSTSSGDLTGTLTVGNSYEDYSRLYAEGGLTYQVNNVGLYAAVRQGFYADNAFKNAGTSLRVGAKVRF